MREPKLYPTNRKTFVVAWPELKGNKLVRARREYSSEEKANAHFEELRKRFPVVGAAGLVMDDEQRAEFYAAKKILPEGVSLSDAARFYVSSVPDLAPLDAADALKEWLLIAARTDKSLRTSKDRKNRVEKFLADRTIRHVSDITVEEIEAWLWRGVSNQTLIQDASFIRSFCRWLVQRKRVLKSNPVDQIALPAADDPDPRTLDASQIRDLLEAAMEWPFPNEKTDKRSARQEKLKGCMVPFLAIACFAGLRPSEITRLTIDSVKLDAADPFIRVRKLKRGRGIRLTPITNTLRAWLVAYPVEFPVYFSKKGFEAIRAKAGLFDDWQGDMMRHTCISVWLATGWNEDVVASASGNSPKIIHRYYRDLLTREEAGAVLSVLP